MGQRTIGIDLAIRGDHVARIFDDGRPHAKPIHFRLTSESLSSLVARLRERLPADSTITAVMEPTGMSWFPVARWLERAGIKAIRVKGQRVRALRRYLSEHTKTDAADAYVLGAIPWFGGVPVDPVYVPNADRHALQRLTRQRERLEDEVSTIKRRLIDLVRWACPAIEAVLPDFRTNLALAVLHDLLNPMTVIKARRTTLLGFIAKHASGNHPHSGPFAHKLVDGLKAAAMETRRLHGDAVNFDTCSWKPPSRSIACACWKASSVVSAAKSKGSTANFIRRMLCAPYQGSATHWRLLYWACCMRPDGLRDCISSVASAGCSRVPTRRAAPINLAKASPNPATTASNARSISPPMPRAGSIPA